MQYSVCIPDQAIQEDKDLERFCEALQKLVNRMAVSHFKYGAMGDKYPASAHAIDNLDKRRKMYAKSGNTEDCLDMANFAIIEYLFPSHAKAHFAAQESSQSPGLVWKK